MAGEQIISNVVDEQTSEPETTTVQSTSDVEAPAQAAALPEGEAAAKKPGKVPESLKPKATDQERFRGRISELVNARKVTDEENRRLREELDQYRQLRTKEVRTGETDTAPKEEDFESYKDFILAAAKWDLKQEQAKQRDEQAKQDAERDTQRYRAQKRQEFEKHAASVVAEVPEFWDAVTDPNLPVSDAMADAVMELGELAPYTMLWLAANRQESLKMCGLPPHAAALAIGRLAERLLKDLGADQGESQPGIDTQNGHGTELSHGSVNRLAVPKPVPTIRGGAPGNMNGEPSDRDDKFTWYYKDAERMRKKYNNPNLRVYVPRKA